MAARGHGEDHRHDPASTAGPRLSSRTRVLGIASGKGGVGKSTVAVNLGVALAQRGHSVAILDADVYGFSVPAMLGIDWAPDVIDHHVLIPPVAHGVGCISMGFFVNDEDPLMWRGPMLHKALNQFLTDVQWGEPDYLLVDLPPGTGDVAMSMTQLLPQAETIVVTTPQPAARRVAQRSGAFAVEAKMALLGVIENMAGYNDSVGARHDVFGSGGGDVLSTQLGVPLLGSVPLSVMVREGGDVGVPVGVSAPESEAAKAFAAIAEVVSTTRPVRSRVFNEALKVV